MILAPHVLVGAAIASKTANPILGILFAFLSHYVLDAVPHSEYSIENLSEKKISLGAAREFLLALSDVGVGLFIVYLLTRSGPSPLLVLISGFVAAVPDAIGVIGGYMIPRPLLKVINAGHDLHFDRKTKTPPIVIGVGLQLIFSIAAIVLILT